MIPPLMGRKKAVTMILGLDKAPDPVKSPASDDALVAIAEDFVRAVESKDAAAVADAFRAAFNVLESEEYEAEED